MVPFGKRPKTLPQVLSGEEVSRLIECVKNAKHRTFLLTLYSAGLRLSEAAQLKIADINSQRMQLRVACGKGAKERRVPLSPRLLTELRAYWKQYRPPLYLFPGKTNDVPLAPTTIQKVVKAAVLESGHRSHDHTAHFASQFRDSLAGSGSGPADDQPFTGTQKFQHNDEVSACATTASEQRAITGRLAAGQTTPRLAATGQQQQRNRKQQRANRRSE